MPKYDTAGLRVTFEYSDGTQCKLKLHYNRQIGHIRGYSSAQLTAFDRVSIGDGYFWNTGIANPCSDKEVKNIKVSSLGIPYLIVGISGE